MPVTCRSTSDSPPCHRKLFADIFHVIEALMYHFLYSVVSVSQNRFELDLEINATLVPFPTNNSSPATPKSPSGTTNRTVDTNATDGPTSLIA